LSGSKFTEHPFPRQFELSPLLQNPNTAPCRDGQAVRAVEKMALQAALLQKKRLVPIRQAALRPTSEHCSWNRPEKIMLATHSHGLSGFFW